jgi:hypothetical protein
MKFFSIIYVAIIVLFICAVNLYAQTIEKPTTCESDSSHLDVLLNKIREEDIIIVISRLGKTEKNINLNKRRLYNVKTYLIDYMKSSILSKHPDNIVLAVADRTNGLGTIEIYFRGKLFSKFYLSNNEDLYIGECAVDLELYKNACDIEAQKIFYPCKKN